MRTKTLLLTAALGVAGIASTTAQVYSVNAVGYVNVSVPSGFSILANPLVNANNTVTNLLPGVADGTIVYKFNTANQQYVANNYFGGWTTPSMTLTPGEGWFLYNPGAPFTLTFIGDVSQGTLTNKLAAGFSLASSIVPQSAQLDTAPPAGLGMPVSDGDIVYTFNTTTQQYVAHNYFGGWNSVPVPGVGEGFFVFKSTSADWVRTFNVNN